MRPGLSDCLTPSNSFQKRLGCYRNTYYDVSTKYPEDSRVWLDNAGIDSVAAYVVSYSYGFLERQFGKVYLEAQTSYDLPDIYWVATVKPFCYTTYIEDPMWNFHFARGRINYALRDVMNLPEGFGCSDYATMKRQECEVWLGPRDSKRR